MDSREPAEAWDYDVVVVGAGPGGGDCARELAEQGLRVVLINDAPLPGGECLWRGCIPSKTWRAAADRLRDRLHDSHLGVYGSTPHLDWQGLAQRWRQILEAQGQMALKADQGLKINFLQGFARFEDDHHLALAAAASDDPYQRRAPRGEGGERISFGSAVIATGAPPFVPPIPGAHEALTDGGVLTSDTVWSLTAVPERLAIIGAGAIGVEMAQIFQDFGAEVTLIEAQDRILAEVEPEVAKQLTAVLAADPRLQVHVGASVSAVDGEPGRMTVCFDTPEAGDQRVGCDRVMMATGKRPDLAALGLAQAGVTTAEGFICVDAQMRTSVPHIFAVGDGVGGLMLAHTASAQGRVAAATIAGHAARYDQSVDCGVIFTRPQAAFVGLSVAEAKARGMDAAEVKVPVSVDAKAMIDGETQGVIKLVADQTSQRIVGVHLLADHADTLIGEGVMMVAAGLTLEQVAGAIHPHPTQTELFGDLARRLLSRLRRRQRRVQTQAKV